MSLIFNSRRQPSNPGPAAWNAILPTQEKPRVLHDRETADVAIIGAGFAGLSASRRLLQLDPSLEVVVLEAHRIGDGPAGRNSGFMIDLPHDLSSDDYAGSGMAEDKRQTRLNRLAIRFAGEAVEEYDIVGEAYSPSGKINAAASVAGDRHNREYGEYLAAMGEAHAHLDESGMRELTGTDYYLSGLHTPGTVMLQPALYVRGLAAGIARKARIFENSPVLGISRNGSAWEVRTRFGVVVARKLILAVNGHVESFGFFERRLMHVFTYASMTRALSPGECGRLGGEPRWGLTPADPMGATVRRISGTGGERIVVRVRFTYDPSMQVPESRLASVGRLHDRSFKKRFPMLDGVDMEYRWGGHLCLSRNGVPAFGEVEDGIFSACCQNGLGTAKGTLSGMAAAELAVGQPGESAEGLSGMDAPRCLPPEPIAWIGANAYLRYKEIRAGAER